MRFLLYIVFFVPFQLICQENKLFIENDSIKYSHRTGGKIDSLDMTFSNSLSTFPGGGLNTSNNVFTLALLNNHTGLQNFRNPISFKNMRFSGTPHVGFSYSFGSKGTQFLHFDYQQAISKNTLLNIEGERNSSAGFLRNSKYSDNNIQVALRKNTKFYSYSLESFYVAKMISENGGVTDFSTIESQGLEFLPVSQGNAQSIFKNANIKLCNYFNLLNDSTTFIGVTTKHQYEVTSRVYTETSIYSNWNISEFATRDQYRIASIRNSAGFFTKKKGLYLDVLLQHRFWDYQNLGMHKDTNEVNLTSTLQFIKKNFTLKNELYYNIHGAGGEWSNKSFASTNVGKWNFAGVVEAGQKWPDQFQRFYYANLTNYKLTNLELQGRFLSSFTSKYNFSNSTFVQVSLQSMMLKNNYFFLDNTWRNDTLNSILINNLIFSGAIKLGILHIQPKITITIPSNNFNYIPSSTFNSRIFIKKKMFKAKKLEGVFGTDISWISSYRLMSYTSSMDVFSLEKTNMNFNSMMNISAFFGFSLGEFRFYTRLENLGYFWNNPQNQVLIGYPIQKNFIRLGITWDFFN